MLKQDSLLWYAALHQEQLNATISLELNESLDWNDWNIHYSTLNYRENRYLIHKLPVCSFMIVRRINISLVYILLYNVLVFT